jgi:allophanate hydrolase
MPDLSIDPTALLTLNDWRVAYRNGARPNDLLAALLARLAADDPAWILRCDAARLQAQLERLAERQGAGAALPLYGVPFAVKDNIDVACWPTTAACPAYAYTPARHASVVERLLDAGAVLVGKTNLDQFATGLVGTRSPYGAVPNPIDPTRVSGGSSSGSASVVARGLVPFALGTDTAGSGRVPAGFNHLVGLKPTPGRLGMQGVLPACRTLDVVSVFALSVADAAEVLAVIDGPDDGPVFQEHPLRPTWLGRLGRPLRIGVPSDTAELDQRLGYPAAWAAALERLTTFAAADGAEPPAWAGTGIEIVPVDLTPFFAVAQLLYDGPWVAERHSVVRALLREQPEALDDTVRRVIARAAEFDATATFEAQYRLQALARQTEPTWAQIDVLLLPTAPTHPTLAAVAAEPVQRNSELGRYTNFVNLLGLAALAVPAGVTPQGLPFGVTWVAPGGSDAALVALGARWQQTALAASAAPQPVGAGLRALTKAELRPAVLPACAPTLALAVVGAHLAGMPLHGQLVERGCRLLARTRSAPHYRLHALPGTQPPKPGLARVAPGEAGAAIELEVYEMPLDAVGSFLALIPPPLGLGSVELADGRWVKGFICEPAALQGAPDISHLGGWRAYMASRA